MNKGRILVVEEDADISNMLRIYFDSQGYEVLVTNRCDSALRICRTRLPKVVLLNIQLSDTDDFLDNLHSDIRTKHIPTVLLVPGDYQGEIPKPDVTDDYIIMPFDIEELSRSVQAAILRPSREDLRHPVTNLPSGQLIVGQVNRAKETADAWVLLRLRIHVFGAIDANRVAVSLVDIACETVEAHGIQDDFLIGQTLADDFIILIRLEIASKIYHAIARRFNEQMGDVAKLRIVSRPSLL